jgi:pimeloyl-ACP methyl ester carboxylesterase
MAQKPTLLVSGDRDDISPLPILQELTAHLPDPKQLVTIPAADHFFRGREREVAQAAVMFLQAQASNARSVP